MLHDVTKADTMQSGEWLARELGGIDYSSLTEVAKRVGVTRQTIWRKASTSGTSSSSLWMARCET
jgi:DNA-binding phage protein